MFVVIGKQTLRLAGGVVSITFSAFTVPLVRGWGGGGLRVEVCVSPCGQCWLLLCSTPASFRQSPFFLPLFARTLALFRAGASKRNPCRSPPPPHHHPNSACASMALSKHNDPVSGHLLGSPNGAEWKVLVSPLCVGRQGGNVRAPVGPSVALTFMLRK